MCGFFIYYSSLVSSQVQESTVRVCLNQMSHRGPDNLSISTSNAVTFGHVRLAIQDLSPLANQPFYSQCNRYILCFNGEIYNAHFLRKELSQLGVTFRTSNSDTEVLLYWLITYGTSRLDSLDGEWSFVFYDSVTNSYTLCRDRAGTKPLYYYHVPDQIFIGSSELKPLLSTRVTPFDICPEGLESYLVHGASQAPFTLIQDVFKVRPGEFIICTDTNISKHQWWSHESTSSSQIKAITNIQCHDLTVDSVISRTISDVPFGVLFSGGVDSSIIASIISSDPLFTCNTFTVGFNPKPSFDESDKAKYLSNLYGTTHHQLTLQGSDDTKLISDLVSKYDTPLSDWVNLPLYFISRYAKEKGFSVLLSGEGADELFMGYPAYFRYIILDLICQLPINTVARLIPKNIRQTISKLFPSTYSKVLHVLKSHGLYGSTFISNSLVFSPHDLSDSSPYLIPDLSKYRSTKSTISRIRNAEFNVRLPELLLMRVDNMTMLNSVEVRVPFLSAPLLNLVLPQRASFLAPFNKPKYLLKRAFNSLPRSVLYAKKTGFGTPVPDWFKGSFKSYICTTILKLNSSNQLFRQPWLSTLISNSESQSLYLRTQSIWQLWTLFVLLVWYDSINSLPSPPNS